MFGNCKHTKSKIYIEKNYNKIQKALKLLVKNKIIDRVVYIKNYENKKIYQKWFNNYSDQPYSLCDQQLLITLKGFETIKTKYVFQTDSNIIYCNKNFNAFYENYQNFKNQNLLTASLNIYKQNHNPITPKYYVEAHLCFINLIKLKKLLPLHNPLNESKIFIFSWYQALNENVNPINSLKYLSNDLCFIYPRNKLKLTNQCKYTKDYLEITQKVDDSQINCINLAKEFGEWNIPLKYDFIILIKGMNTSHSKLLRLFRSLKHQTFQEFQIIYIDDDSDNDTHEYVKMITKYDSNLKEKMLYLHNVKKMGFLLNIKYVMKYLIKNPEAIIVNIDSNDSLLRNDALELINNAFKTKANIVLGNCLELNNPLNNCEINNLKKAKEYFENNVWLHLRCFKRYMFNYVLNSEKIDNKGIDKNSNYAIMLPIIKNTKKYIYIKEKIYFSQS